MVSRLQLAFWCAASSALTLALLIVIAVNTGGSPCVS